MHYACVLKDFDILFKNEAHDWQDYVSNQSENV